ncbi:hypothetical protein BN2476_2100001 [Paraburkholderia piptadeniae]|uniref:Uncharacterized protein n=1 Tax=Paraburkholderia piptadeniae TaxID=1701573 RepID=A0A1N7SXL4_9BURK|nr:hypothetical protein BN2476_2100001 [Paraburkholderia piptadeniae]
MKSNIKSLPAVMVGDGTLDELDSTLASVEKYQFHCNWPFAHAIYDHQHGPGSVNGQNGRGGAQTSAYGSSTLPAEVAFMLRGERSKALAEFASRRRRAMLTAAWVR